MVNKIVLILIVFFASCKKYEQGPAFSLRSKKQRLIGVWTPKLIYDLSDITLTYPNDGYFEFNGKNGYTEYSNGVTYEGEWQFSADKKQIVVKNPGLYIYHIKKLKKKELWLVDSVANKEYHFER